MGNLWATAQVRPVNGTYLEDRPLRRQHKPAHQRVASFIPLVHTTTTSTSTSTSTELPKPIMQVVRHAHAHTPFKEKALRICQDVALRSRVFSRGTLPQTQD